MESRNAYIKELEAVHTLKKQGFVSLAESKKRQEEIFQEMRDKGIELPFEYTQDMKTKTSPRVGVIAASVICSVLLTVIVMHFVHQNITVEHVGDFKSFFQSQREQSLNNKQNAGFTAQDNDYDKLLNDLALKNNSQPTSEQKYDFVSGVGKDLGIAGHMGLQEDEIKIIAKMPSRFIKAYQAGGTIQVSGERNKCYEAAKQIKERSLVIQCIALDTVGCAIIPSMEKNGGFPSDLDFSEAICFKRALNASSALFPTEAEQNKFANTVVKQAIQEINERDWSDLGS